MPMRIRNQLQGFPQVTYDRLMKTLDHALAFQRSDPARFRLHVVEHAQQYGWRSAHSAFRVSRPTIFRWQKQFLDSGRSLVSLIPHKTRPHHFRVMQTDYRIIEFIKQVRKEYGNLDKRKIEVLLSQYCLDIGIESISATTIGKIIRRKRFRFNTKKVRRKPLVTRERVKRSPKITRPGYIQMDSVIVCIHHKTYRFMTVIDVYTKFAWVRLVPSLSAKQATLTFQEYSQQISYPIHTVQTDNGSEFLGAFHEYVIAEQMFHLFSYPRSPKTNAFVERLNRTIQEECLNDCDGLALDDEKILTDELKNYLNWYNTKRPHMALNYLSPQSFINQLSLKCV